MELDRFFRELVNAIREYDPSRLHQTHRLRDIQYGLVPYRSVRKTLGLECSEDHEMLLLRLCAGEGGYLILADEDSRRAFSEEVDGVNPDLGLLQVYGDIEVSLVAQAIHDSMTDPQQKSAYRPPDVAPVPDLEEDEPVELEDEQEVEPAVVTLQDTAPTSAESTPAPTPEMVEVVVAQPEPEPEPKPEPEPSVEMPSPSSPMADTSPEDDSSAPEEVAPVPPCAYCGGSLPATRQAHFCPHCGEDLTVIRCDKCSEELEDGWRHCIACGQRVSDS